MDLKNKNIGFGLTGAFYYFNNSILQIKELLKRNANVIPIMSYNAYKLDGEFKENEKFIKEIEEITGNKVIHTIKDAEKIGPNGLTDIMIIAPCTGNTIAKLASGISDTPILMSTKANLRNDNPVVIAVSTNDGLSGNAENIGRLLNRKNYFFVPYRQDNPITKPRSIVYDSKYLVKTLEYALDKEQIQPILL